MQSNVSAFKTFAGPLLEAHTRFGVGSSLTSLLVLVVLVVGDRLEFGVAVGLSTVAAIPALLFLWMRFSSNRGQVILDEAGINVESRNGSQHISWCDLRDAELVRLRDSSPIDYFWCRIMAIKVDEPAVVLRLSRSLRVSLAGNRYGTRISGVPTIIVRELRLYVKDPTGLLAAVSRYRTASGDV